MERLKAFLFYNKVENFFKADIVQFVIDLSFLAANKSKDFFLPTLHIFNNSEGA